MERLNGPTFNLYPLQNYEIGAKDPLYEKDRTIPERMNRIKKHVDEEGMRNSVHGVLLVHEHNHPLVLLLQVTQNYFKLPGGRLRPGDDETDTLRRKLDNKIGPTLESLRPIWEVGDLVAKWWRPNYETAMFPYIPPHITDPKECVKLFCVPLPQHCKFAVPRNMKLMAVPLFDLYDNKDRYGPLISSLPAQLGRFNFNCL